MDLMNTIHLASIPNEVSLRDSRWFHSISLRTTHESTVSLVIFFLIEIFAKEEIRKHEVFSGCHEISMNGNVRHREHQKERYGIFKNLWQQNTIMVDCSIAQLYMIYARFTQNWYQIWHVEENRVLTSLHIVNSLF